MKFALLFLALAPSLALAYTPAQPAKGFCYGIPQMANNSDGEDWDGKTPLSFELIQKQGDALYHTARVDLAESEGEPVPYVVVNVYEGYRTLAVSLDYAVYDSRGNFVDKAGTALPNPTIANQIGFNVSSDVTVEGETYHISCHVEPGNLFPAF